MNTRMKHYFIRLYVFRRMDFREDMNLSPANVFIIKKRIIDTITELNPTSTFNVIYKRWKSLWLGQRYWTRPKCTLVGCIDYSISESTFRNVISINWYSNNILMNKANKSAIFTDTSKLEGWVGIIINSENFGFKLSYIN